MPNSISAVNVAILCGVNEGERQNQILRIERINQEREATLKKIEVFTLGKIQRKIFAYICSIIAKFWGMPLLSLTAPIE
jgi:hypothetical protein